jgi:hypothetical protein
VGRKATLDQDTPPGGQLLTQQHPHLDLREPIAARATGGSGNTVRRSNTVTGSWGDPRIYLRHRSYHFDLISPAIRLGDSPGL